MKIYLSPSLQENNIGFGNYGSEQSRMIQICNDVNDQLLKYGHETKVSNPQMTLKQAIDDSNIFSPTIHVAIHSNAFNTKTQGCEIFCYKFGGEGEILARLIYTYLENETTSRDRGVKENSRLYELRATTSIAVLIEIAFHDNEVDARWIMENTHLIAKSIVKGINDYAHVLNVPDINPKLIISTLEKEKDFYIKALENIVEIATNTLDK